MIAKQVFAEYTLAMVNYEHVQPPQPPKDFTLFVVYDHRLNN